MRSSVRVAGTILAVLEALAGRALAEEPPRMTPPVAAVNTDVPYPTGAAGDGVVELEVVVEKDGSVSSAIVTSGVEPFAGQARSAVMKWKFTPARRGDVAVAAKVRARVAFHEEAAEPAPAPPPSPAAPKKSAPTAPETPPQEVNVRGSRHDVGRTTLSATDMREIPGAFGDPFRAIDALPGVIPILSGLPYFYIRGAPPNDNGYYVDRIRVPFLFHMGVGEGILHPSLIDHVDFYPGAAPASYGGFAGATIAGQTREPATKPHGEVNVRLIDSGTLLETPFADGRGTVLVAGRYGYPGPIVSAITPGLQLGYWDYQGRITWRVSDHDTASIFAFGSHDYLGTQNATIEVTGSNSTQENTLVDVFQSDTHRVDLRWDHTMRGGRVRVATTFGYDSQNAHSGVTDTSAAARIEFEQNVSSTLRVRGGADARIDNYSLQLGTNTDAEVLPLVLGPPTSNATGGVYVDVVWRPIPRVEIVPGVRVDVFQSSRDTQIIGFSPNVIEPAVDPRLSARVTLSPDVAWLSTFGVSHQYPTIRLGNIPPEFVSIPGFPYADTQLQTVMQASQGIEVALPADFVLTTTAFLSGWTGLTDLTSGCETPIANTGSGPTVYTCPSDDPVQGKAYGVELLVRRPLSKRLGGWLSYTLSRTTREAHYPTYPVPTLGSDLTTTVPGDYDRTHVLSAILSYDFGHAWRAGGRFVFYTGAPYSQEVAGLPVPPYNAYRFPPFYRVDLRIEKRWNFDHERSIAVVLEGQNITLSKESYGYACSTQSGGGAVFNGANSPTTTTCSIATIGPITIPSIGVEAFF